MAETTYQVTAMINNDHSYWKTMTVKAKNEDAAKKKAEKNLSKFPGVNEWAITDIIKDE